MIEQGQGSMKMKAKDAKGMEMGMGKGDGKLVTSKNATQAMIEAKEELKQKVAKEKKGTN